MRYTGPPGMMLDLVQPSPGGVNVEYMHPYTDANLYRYSSNNPTSRVDPSGLEDFYVCEQRVQQPGSARFCGCQHTDIFGSQSGPIYNGYGGPQSPLTNTGIPRGPGWKCTKLHITTVDRYLTTISIVTRPKTFRWGPRAGKSCVGATSADIFACLQSKPKPAGPAGTPGVITNCQTDVYEAAEGCCLTGFSPLSLLPPNQGLSGPKY